MAKALPRRWTAALVAALLLPDLIGVMPRAMPAAGQGAQEGLRWASLGDSYAAGEGLEHPSRSTQTDRECQRALAGDAYPSVAWGAAAAENRAGPYAFVACTGAITDDLFPAPAGRLQAGQRDQAIFLAGQRRFDVVTLSFGGNNLDFVGVLLSCAGVSITGGATAVIGGVGSWANAPWVGCTLSENEMKTRIDALTDPESVKGTLPACNALGDASSTSAHWDDDRLVQGRITLPELYDVVGRCVAAPGGTVVVMGYPQLLEEGDRWSRLEGNRCHRIRRADVGKLRGATAHLNFRIHEAVIQANERSPGRFVFVDPNHFWEGGRLDLSEPSASERNEPSNRHSLCAGGDPWLNGLTVGTKGQGALRVYRSFHPNQEGHGAMAKAVSSIPFAIAPQVPPDVGTGIVVLPEGTCREVVQYIPGAQPPLHLVDGEVPIPAGPPGIPYVGLTFGQVGPGSKELDPVTTGDLDNDGRPEILAVIMCGTGGSGAWNDIAVFDSYLEPLGVVPMGQDVEPPWEFLVTSLEVRDQVLEVAYSGGEEDEALCCGTRMVTDRFAYDDGEFVRVERVQVTGLSWMNDFLAAVNAGNRPRALQLATVEVVDRALSEVAKGAKFELCDDSFGQLSLMDDTSDRICYSATAEANWLLRATPQDIGIWQITRLDRFYEGE